METPRRRRVGFRRTKSVFLLALTLLVPCLCAGGHDSVRQNDGEARTVHVLSNGFHTGIVLEMGGDARGRLLCADLFREYRYIDAGWGDEVFYRDPNAGLGTGARALLVPSSSVIRIEGFNADIRDAAAWSENAVKVTLENGQYRRLCEYINESFLRGPSGEPVIASKRGAGGVIFFKSTKKYNLFNTCNTWVAGAFRHAGLDISAAGVITAGTLFRRLRKTGAVEEVR
jgi:uncharacterized protein (TIGR02117 family)